MSKAEEKGVSRWREQLANVVLQAARVSGYAFGRLCVACGCTVDL